jgi:dTMP kinase
MTRAKFITFEGIDGAGKSTHLAFVAGACSASAKTPWSSRVNPAAPALGESLRTISCCMKKCIWKPKRSADVRGAP